MSKNSYKWKMVNEESYPKLKKAIATLRDAGVSYATVGDVIRKSYLTIRRIEDSTDYNNYKELLRGTRAKYSTKSIVQIDVQTPIEYRLSKVEDKLEKLERAVLQIL